VVFVILPAYLVYEPESTEKVSFKLGVVACTSTLVLFIAFSRAFLSWYRTMKLVYDWQEAGQLICLPGVDVPTYLIAHPFPVIAVLGVFRPRLFIARQVLESLSTKELCAALSHETGHLHSRDNLKRWLLLICTDLLILVPRSHSVYQAWAEAAEEGADEYSVGYGRNAPLDLASALVKIARMITSQATPLLPAGALFVRDAQREVVNVRIRRLLKLAADGVQDSRTSTPSVQTRVALVTVVIVGLIAAADLEILFAVHLMIEKAVHFLS
jgi:hypothetical protein